MTPRSYFGKMNSTLGSVVPLAMFFGQSLSVRGLDKSSYNPGGLTSTPIVTLMTKLVDKEEMGAVMAMCSGVEQVASFHRQLEHNPSL